MYSEKPTTSGESTAADTSHPVQIKGDALKSSSLEQEKKNTKSASFVVVLHEVF